MIVISAMKVKVSGSDPFKAQEHQANRSFFRTFDFLSSFSRI
jgi:hypothetical protein